MYGLDESLVDWRAALPGNRCGRLETMLFAHVVLRLKMCTVDVTTDSCYLSWKRR